MAHSQGALVPNLSVFVGAANLDLMKSQNVWVANFDLTRFWHHHLGFCVVLLHVSELVEGSVGKLLPQ